MGVAVVNTVLLVVAVLNLLWAVLVLKPMWVRARVGHEAKMIEYRVLDAMLRGDIQADDPALDELIAYSRLLSERAKSIGLTEAAALMSAAASTGIDPKALPPRASYAEMTPAGRSIAMEADRELHHMLADYLTRGSRAWLVLEPTRWLLRSRRRRHTTNTNPKPWVPSGLPTPGEAATGYRAAIHDDRVRGFLDEPLAA
ncbi:hypothetical protein [Cellulomonas olei]|uniref:hypothetical protein n=1 Tax=Cellulomonas sp. P4 TaxID=3142533 RepID=UPI0031BA165E